MPHGIASTYLDGMEERKKSYAMKICEKCKIKLPYYCYDENKEICQKCDKKEK